MTAEGYLNEDEEVDLIHKFTYGAEGCGERKSGRFSSSGRALTAHVLKAKHRVSFCASFSNHSQKEK